MRKGDAIPALVGLVALLGAAAVWHQLARIAESIDRLQVCESEELPGAIEALKPVEPGTVDAVTAEHVRQDVVAIREILAAADTGTKSAVKLTGPDGQALVDRAELQRLAAKTIDDDIRKRYRASAKRAVARAQADVQQSAGSWKKRYGWNDEMTEQVVRTLQGELAKAEPYIAGDAVTADIGQTKREVFTSGEEKLQKILSAEQYADWKKNTNDWIGGLFATGRSSVNSLDAREKR